MAGDEGMPGNLNIVAGSWDLLFVFFVISDPTILDTLLKLYRW
jgi:hypothetical protein